MIAYFFMCIIHIDVNFVHSCSFHKKFMWRQKINRLQHYNHWHSSTNCFSLLLNISRGREIKKNRQKNDFLLAQKLLLHPIVRTVYTVFFMVYDEKKQKTSSPMHAHVYTYINLIKSIKKFNNQNPLIIAFEH